MVVVWETVASGLLAAVSMVAAYFSLVAYNNFKGDVMGKFFGVMVTAFVFGAGVDTLALVVSLAESEETFEAMLIPGVMITLGLLTVGMIPLLRWATDSIVD